MKTKQAGSSTLSLLLWVGLMVALLYWVLSEYLPADATDVQGVVALAAPSAEARKVLSESLKGTPNPDRIDLSRMRNRVNEVLVTETARVATGDKTLEAPADRRTRLDREEQMRVAQLEAKAWGEMTNEERAKFIASKWNIVFFALLVVAFALFGWRTMMSAQRGY